MFGLIGAAIYGIAYAVGWTIDEQREQHSRKSSKENGLNYYVDKKGRQRWTKTGKKRTAQEILKEKELLREKDRRDRNKYFEKQVLEKYKKEYEAFVVHKDKISFEEYVASHISQYYLEYDGLAKIKNSVSEDRINEIKKHPLIFG